MFTATVKVPDTANPTFVETLRPLSNCFIEFWRVVYADKTLSWDDAIPPTAHNAVIYLLAPVGHWSRDGYAKNFPIFALPHIDWVADTR